ncbi:hypothetical protein XELAEV_18022558mg [Xenopus laevis]|uniref:Cryptochrome/DNA photolyase FAD-binding domain-containing protein n=1 Tax=Xenopus laevis TaxID=8355 RepID=A0A974D5A1_XENLA|nr:hypothetical protein XELAEV_18022558mg [Xenopus laevis]
MNCSAIDADVVINAMMWQNGGISCDLYGLYMSKWCPELAGFPDEFIPKPWKCAPSQLQRAGVILGQNYHHRIVLNLEEKPEQTLKDVVDVRKKHLEYLDEVSGSDMIPIRDQLLALTLG